MQKTLRPYLEDIDLSRKNKTIHIVVWIIFYFLLLIFDNSGISLAFNIVIEAINIFFYIILIYFNVLYLIPHFLSQKNFLKYCLYLVLSVLIITPIKLFVIYELFSFYPESRNALLAHQSWFFLINFIIVSASSIIKIVIDWISYQQKSHALQTQTMQSELRFLKSQINPHFLFNTLNNLYALTLKKSDKAPEIVIKLSEMMRYMLYECNEKKVFLSKEVHYLKNYLDLEELRKGKAVDISLKTEGNIDKQMIAPLMFIPFIENSFKHGISNNIKKGFVNIVLKVEEDTIDFYIENSKADGLPTQTHKRSGGIGLVNVRRRLDLLYPDNYKLDIQNTPNTYTVNLILNTNK